MKKNRNKQLPIPLEVKVSMLKFAILSIILLLIGLGMLCYILTDSKNTISILLLACLIIIVGIVLAFLCIKSKGQVILTVDEEGITYRPIAFGKYESVGPVRWTDITDIDIKTVHAGKSTQSYFQVQVKNLADYHLGKNKKSYHNLSKYNLGGGNVDHTAILAPLAMLKVKKDALLATCLVEHAKHPQLEPENDAEQPYEIESNTSISDSVQLESEDAERKKMKARANLITIALIVIVLIGGGLAFFKAQTKYVGLKNKVQYYMTESNAESPNIIFSFKLYDSMSAKYPVILFATQYDDNMVLNKKNVKALKAIQNKVIQNDKIYALKQDGDNFASYSKYKIQNNQINMDLVDGAGKYLLANVDYISIANIKRDNQTHHFTATLKSRQDNQDQSIPVNIYSEDDLAKLNSFH